MTETQQHVSGQIRGESLAQPRIAGSVEAQTAPPILDAVLRAPGRPLDAVTRAFMEPRFGYDFSRVRVHSDAAAQKSARDLGAQAYTVGHHIAFDDRRFAPETHEGRRLIAHELTHVVQQSGPGGNRHHQGITVARKESDTPKIGPAATIPERRGDIERGYFSTTDKVMYGVRASGPGKETGLWVDHLFETQPEAEEYAKHLAATGADAIRTNTALPYAWAPNSAGGKPVTGNPVTHVYVMEVPAGTGYIQGVVAPQDEHRNASWVPKSWAGGGPQTVLSWEGKKTIVATFGVAKAAQAEPQAIPPPPDQLTAPKPVTPTAPASAVSADDPRAVARLYSPNLVREYRSQQQLYNYSQSALSEIEDREAGLKKAGLELSADDKKRKEILAKQVAAAQAQMLQARRDFELLDNPATTPKELQELFARRGIAIPVGPQSNATGAALIDPAAAAAKADYERRKANEKLYGKRSDELLSPEDRLTPAERQAGKALVDQQGSWQLDDKGVSKKGSTATTQTVIGPDGAPVTFTKEKTSATTIGLGTATHVTGEKDTAVSGNKSITTGQQTSLGVDLIKGEGSYSSKDKTAEIKDDSGTTTKTSDKTSYTAGLGGVTRTKEDSIQVGDKLDTKSSTAGITRAPGQLGLTAGTTYKSGTVVGPPGAEKLEKGSEKSNKLTGGLVSDEKGTGIGGTASQDRKTLFGDGKSVTSTIAAGGRCQVLVKEVEGSDPLTFTITTTISFDVKLGGTATKEWEAKPDAQKDTGAKASVSLGATASIGAYASFKRALTDAEARKYIEFVQANGRGSKLPEHMILATGASKGWGAAKQLWSAMRKSSGLLQKSGDEVETNVEVAGDAKAGASGGGSGQGGLSVGGEVSIKAKHKINVKQAVLADGKIQVTATIDDERELGVSGTGGFGAASGSVGKSVTKGAGRTIVFILDPKNENAFASQLSAINAAVTPQDLDNLAVQNPSLVASRTQKTVEGEGSSVGAAAGLSIDLAGKGRLTSEVTRDQQGNIIGTKATGENQGGGTVGIGGLKVGDSKTESYVGEVDKEGHAKGELAVTTKSSSLKKTLVNAGSKVSQDPLGTILHPDKLVEEDVEAKGTAIADPEIMSICYTALDRPKWNGKVGGSRHDDWVAAGIKIRQACKVRNGEIYQVDKSAVQLALAEWTKADVEGRKEVLDTIIRPLGGIPGGKAFAFPDGLESLKPAWDSLIVSDPLAALKGMKPEAARAEMLRVKGNLNSLFNSVKSQSTKWQGLELQRAEMLGHINTRQNQIEDAIRDLTKKIPAAPAVATPGVATPTAAAAKTPEDVKHDEAVQKTEQVRAWLDTYNRNIPVMKEYSDSVFAKINSADARLKESGIFVASMQSRIIEVIPQIKQAEDLIKLWDALYWPTYQLYEQISPYLAIDKSRVEKLHPAGARGRWQQVYDQTRDTSVAGH